jgi:hypothetical protein
MDDTMGTLRGYVRDMLAVERDIHAAFRRHRQGKIRASEPVARVAAENTRDAWRIGSTPEVHA